MSRADHPAFPVDVVDHYHGGPLAGETNMRQVGGLTIREYYAGLAMQGILSCFQEYGVGAGNGTAETRAAQAVRHADALLSALQVKP